MTLTTMIAELEEAERKNALRAKRVADAIAGKYRIPYDEEQQMRLELDAYESLLWRHRNTLIEALKRQGEALEPFAEKARWYRPDEAEYEIGSMIRVADLFAARAALKETPDV